MNMVVNLAHRTLAGMFPGFFSASTKHDHYRDYGWPEQLQFLNYYRMYTRNSLANSAVDKTISKTWQDNPEIWESDKPSESQLEKLIRVRFRDLRVWQRMAMADTRSMVGSYSALILRVGDGQPFDQPVGRVPGGLEGLVEVIPAWESQLTVSEWSTDPRSPDYGQPLWYEFREIPPGKQSNVPARSVRIHPDRVLIWSDDGTVNGISALEAGYNDLLDAEKIKGAGGEGFWKTSRGAPMLEAAEGMTPDKVAKSMGTNAAGLLDALNEQLEAFQQGFDKGLMLGGFTVKPLSITLPSPEHFFSQNVRSFAASVSIPEKILLGSQTGERASTEDVKEWNATCMSRRNIRNRPLIMEFMRRLVRFGILPEKDWTIGWTDLTESTPSEKMDKAVKMTDINSKTLPGDQPPFLPEEIREAAGFEPDIPADREPVAKPEPVDPDDDPDEDDPNPEDEE